MTTIIPKLIENIKREVKKNSNTNLLDSNCSKQKVPIVSIYDTDYFDYISDDSVFYYIDFISNGHVLTCLKGITDWDIDNMTHRIIGHPKGIYYYVKEISNSRITAAFNHVYNSGIHIFDYQTNIITGEILFDFMDFEIKQIMELPNNKLAISAIYNITILNLNVNSIIKSFNRIFSPKFEMINNNYLLLLNLSYIDLLQLEIKTNDFSKEGNRFNSIVHWKDDLYYLSTENEIILFQEHLKTIETQWKMNYQKEERQPDDFLIKKIQLIDKNTLVVILNMDLLIFKLPNFSNYISKNIDVFPLYGGGFKHIKSYYNLYLVYSTNNFVLCHQDFNPIYIHYNKYSQAVVEINKELLAISITSNEKKVFISTFPNSNTIKYTIETDKIITLVHPLNNGNLLICLYDLCIKLWDSKEKKFIKQTFCPFSFNDIEYVPPEEYKDPTVKLKIINTEYCDIPSLYHFLFVYELNDQYIILGATQFCVLFDLKNWKCLNDIQNVLNENNFAKSSLLLFLKIQ